MPGRAFRRWFYAGSVVFHGALAAVAYSLPREQHTESVAIELADIKKKNEKPKPPPPPPPPPPKEKPKPPPPPPRPQAQAKVAPEPAKAEAPAPEPVGADGFADLGSVALGNVGGSGGGPGDGVAVAGPGKSASAAATKAKPTTRRIEQLAPAAADVCNEPVSKPRVRIFSKPDYLHNVKAREAEIEGVVRVEVTVDERGKVIAARVLSGLGYGLDEDALGAAHKSVFEPATRCGRPVVGTFVMKIRFGLT